MLDLAVIGGGAAGFFAAINTKTLHPNFNVSIFEKSKTVLGKVLVSGGGRCNVTHACFDTRNLVEYYPRGKKELVSIFQRFNPADTIRWFESKGIQLKTEADGRMFPISDDSQTIINCFLKECAELSIAIHTVCPVKNLHKNEVFEIETEIGIVKARNVLVASGSSEYFWNILKGLGHTIIKPVPSLFTFNIKHPFIADLMGISVAKASVRLLADKQDCKEFGLKPSDIVQSGPLLITHWGISGPAILKLSSVAALLLHSKNYKFNISVNLSNRTLEDVKDIIQSFKREFARKQVINTPMFGIPQRWWQRIYSLSFQNANITWSDISNKDCLVLAEHLSNFTLEVNGKSTFKDEFVTAGGIDLKEIDFKTMESKLVQGLYFAGEVLNIDALTGGFNFQAAWSEAWVISQSIKKTNT